MSCLKEGLADLGWRAFCTLMTNFISHFSDGMDQDQENCAHGETWVGVTASREDVPKLNRRMRNKSDNSCKIVEPPRSLQCYITFEKEMILGFLILDTEGGKLGPLVFGFFWPTCMLEFCYGKVSTQRKMCVEGGYCSKTSYASCLQHPCFLSWFHRENAIFTFVPNWAITTYDGRRRMIWQGRANALWERFIEVIRDPSIPILNEKAHFISSREIQVRVKMSNWFIKKPWIVQ